MIENKKTHDRAMLLEFEHTHVTIMHDNEALYDIS
jgi:hypothetical protein